MVADDFEGASHPEMTSGALSGDDRNLLWIERMATFLRFDVLASKLFNSPDYAAYLFFAVVYFFDVPVLSTIRFLQTGYHPFLTNPSMIIVSIGFAFGIWAATRLRDSYERAIWELLARKGIERIEQSPGRLGQFLFWLDSIWKEDAESNKGLHVLVSDRLKLLLLAIGWTFHASWVFFNPGAQEFILGVEGPIIGSIKFFGLLPFVYYVIAVDFAAVYVGILLLLPQKIRATGIISFQDPLGYGFLKPFGELIKSASWYYFLGLAAYIVLTGVSTYHARTGAPVPEAQLVNTIGISLAVVFGGVFFALPVLVIHGHMKHAKHEKIRRLAREVEQCGPVGEEMMFPGKAVTDSRDQSLTYLHYFIKISTVENTHEYPIDVSHLQQIVIAASVPFIARVMVMLLRGYPESIGLTT